MKITLRINTFLLCAMLFFSCHQQKPKQSPPNVLLILTDDMGYGDYSFAGNPYIKTPNLDQMAKESVSFEYFYVSPVCAPTRASLLTGRYHQRADVRSVTNGFETMNPEEHTIAEVLKTQSYATAIFGKWHLGEYYPSVPNAQGFDEYYGFRTGHTDNYFDPVLEHNGKKEKSFGYITDILTDRALDFMLNSTDKPFFCYLAYNAPHTPLQVDSSKFVHFLDMGLNDKTSRVYGMVENIDENIGRMFAKLDEQNLMENTLVIFMSDNGPISKWRAKQHEIRYNGGLRDQKFTIFEGGVRTQCFWMWKNRWKAFRDNSTIAAHVDVLPTLLDYINPSITDTLKVDGISLKSTLEGKTEEKQERIHFENYHLETLREPSEFPGGIARQGKWKMVNGTELYNLKADPAENTNVAEQHPEILKKLSLAYQSFYNDTYSQQNFFPKPIKIGFNQENPVCIQPHHGIASGKVHFLNPTRGNRHPSGVDGSYLGNWKEKGDKVTWEIRFVEKGNYNIGVHLRGTNLTGSLKLKTSEQSWEKSLDGINSEKWTYLEIGEAEIKSLESKELSIEVGEITPDNNMEIKEIVINKTK